MGMRLEIDMPEHQYNNIMSIDSMSLGRMPYKGIIMYAIKAIKRGKVLEQEPTIKNDLGVDKFYKAINQSDLEEWIMETFPDWCEGDVRLIMNHMDEMPSVTPQEPRWIPCDEQMPEEREWIGTKRFGTTISAEVYVTFESPDGVRFAKHLCFQNGKLSNLDQLTIDTFYKGAIPIAWMPLPKAYSEVKKR